MKTHRVSQLRWLLPASVGLVACYGQSNQVTTQDQVVHLEEQALVEAPATPAASETDGDDGGAFDGAGETPSISVDASGGDALDAEGLRPEGARPMPDARPDEDPLGREDEGPQLDLGGVGSAGGDLDTGSTSPAGSTPIDDEVFGGGGDITFIRLDPGQRFQTMDGWEATDYAAQIDSPAWEKYKEELFDLAVNDLGITRIRLEVRAGVENTRDYWQEWRDGLIEYIEYRTNRYVTVNDNDDPNVLDMSGFNFSEMYHNIREVLLPLKDLVEANGEEFFINLC